MHLSRGKREETGLRRGGGGVGGGKKARNVMALVAVASCVIDRKFD